MSEREAGAVVGTVDVPCPKCAQPIALEVRGEIETRGAHIWVLNIPNPAALDDHMEQRHPSH
jgi:hypothetical protein